MTTPAFSPSHGSKAEVYYNGYDLSIYMSTASTANNRDKADASTFKTKVKKYTYGLKETTMSLEGYFDGSKDAVDELMSAAIDADEGVFTHFPTGASLGARGKSMLATTTKYEVTSEIGSTVGVSVEASPGIGGVVENIRALAYETEVTEDGNSSSIDFSAASTKVGTLTVHAFTSGTDLTVTLQDSADNTTFADVASVTFTGGTAEEPVRAGKRSITTNPLRRYARVLWAGAGNIVVAAVGR